MHSVLLHGDGDHLKGHGNEMVFSIFFDKSVWPGSLTQMLKPFRFSLRIRRDIRNRKTTPRIVDTGSRRLLVSTIRGVAVGDSESIF